MSSAEDNVALARARADAAKARLDDSIADLRERVDPRTLARHATDGLREQGEAAVAVAKRNPGIAAGAAAAAGLLLIRRPVMALFGRGRTKSETHTTRKGTKGNPQ
jgi:hypothetical protein